MSRVPEGITNEVMTVVARRVLLDVLETLRAHSNAITLVGAQAVHLRTTGADGLDTPSHTSDADLGIDPVVLDDEPLLEELMAAAGFQQGPDPGRWYRPENIGGRLEDVVVDLMVGASFTRPSRRSAAMPPHSRNAARRTPGLEPAAIDHDMLSVASLEPENDSRRIPVRVAGTAALLVSKAHKLGERAQERNQSRLDAKDAGDVLRLMIAADRSVGPRLQRLLEDRRSREATEVGLRHLDDLFGAPNRLGVVMAVDALGTQIDADQIRALAPAFVQRLRRMVLSE